MIDFQYGFQDVSGIDDLLFVTGSDLSGLLDGFLRFDGKIIKVHMWYVLIRFFLFTKNESNDAPSGE
jgi:hypothetical protein